MYKQGDGYFWIGGPGEEAFNVPLGLLVDKGMGVDHDYLHLHYRSSAHAARDGRRSGRLAPPDEEHRDRPVLARSQLRGPLLGAQVERRAGDVADRGPVLDRDRHRARAAQGARGAKGITIVQGGDAGTAEGDFATCLVWSSRKGNELPLLMIVTNNQFGISTPYEGQHGERPASPTAARRSACRRRRSTATTPRRATRR